jgi:hypothetical protein
LSEKQHIQEENLFEEILVPNQVSQILHSRRDTNQPGVDVIRHVELNQSEVSLEGYLGSGGSKEVYSAVQDGHDFALCICGIQDNSERVVEKWKSVLKEPRNTDELRKRGFHVNDACKISIVKINGHQFPALLMKRYQDHSFSIYDAKNTSGNDNPILEGDKEINDQLMMEVLSSVIDEITALIKEGVILGTDSFNVCLSQGKVHLYFNDLGPMEIKVIQQEEYKEVIDYYVASAIAAFVNSISYKVFQESSYLKKTGSRRHPLGQKICEEVLRRLLEK